MAKTAEQKQAGDAPKQADRDTAPVLVRVTRADRQRIATLLGR